MTDAAHPWALAMRAVAALAVGGPHLRGLIVRARAGPVRRALEDSLRRLPGPAVRIHPSLSDRQLFGGLDIAATLAGMAPVRDAGLAGRPSLLILPMAERTAPELAARLAQLLDAGRGHRLILLDEGAEPDERAPSCLRERLAFEIDLEGISWSDTQSGLPAPGDLDAARRRFDGATCRDDHMAQLAAIAARFGIDTLRAPILAARAARALAALEGRAITGEDDIREAAMLVFASRATQLPEPPESETSPEPASDTTPDDAEADAASGDRRLEDRVVDAITARVPPDLLDRARRQAGREGGMRGSGAGARLKSNRRGRPLPSRPGRPDGRARIDIVATLQAAVPYQAIRNAGRPHKARTVVIHPSDIRLRRFEDCSDRLVIFAVDASGSAAMARMAEAKGAVELLLARAYAKRDQVALITFRKEGADILLPPTRSLVQAKRRLAALPGGGGTPLASGIMAAGDLAVRSRGRGLAPAMVMLTDGRANITLSGAPGRAQAREDAEAAAIQVRRQNIPLVVIDTAARPGEEGERLARWLDARYLALPRGDARGISQITGAAIGG